MQQVHVRKDDLTQATLVDAEAGELPDGAVRLAIESFSVTANNITYAVAGESMGYWNFFPASEGMGIVPMWGHATVTASKHPEIAVGERVYGYLPMATHLDVIPGRISASGFLDTAAHRQPMSPVYNQYSRLAADPEHDANREGERMIFGPLFKTGFLIDYFMRGENWFGGDAVILTSASSKTAMSLASVAKERSPAIKRIGVTSAGNIAFVENTGLYDQVVSYDDIDAIADGPVVTVDFAGNAAVLRTLHEKFTDNLKYSCLVGATHIDERGEGFDGAKDMPGPRPILFFAPDYAIALFKQVGPKEAGQLLATSWYHFLKAVGDTVEIERRSGIAAAKSAYLEMVGGAVDPAKGIVIEP